VGAILGQAKPQIPNPKFQTNFKIPNSKRGPIIRFRDWEFLHYSVCFTWDLVLGIWDFRPTRWVQGAKSEPASIRRRLAIGA
jgi:hypothetical protein